MATRAKNGKLKLDDGSSVIVGSNRETDNRYGSGNTQGWDYGPGRLRPLDLNGLPYQAGVYRRMRDYHPTIKSILDQRRDAIASTKFEFQGIHGKRLNEYFQNSEMDEKPLNLSTLIAHVADNETTYGFCLMEVAYSMSRMDMWRVDPVTVYGFTSTNPSSVDPENVLITNTMRGYETFPFERFALFSQQSWPGNWWGVATLSGLITEFIVWENDTKLYLGQRMLEKGVVIASQKGTDGNVETRDAIESALLGILKGQDVYIVDDGNWEYQVLQINGGQDAVKQRIELNQSLDEKIRQCLNSNLNTLGLSSVGSKALGETIKQNDDEKFSAYIERELNRFVSSGLIAGVCKILGIPQSQVSIGTVGSKYTSDRVQADTILNILQNGTLTLEQLGATNRTLLVEALGLDPTSMKWDYDLPADLKANEVIPSTFAVPQPVRRAVAVGMERFMALPAAQRTALTPRELVLVRRITSGQPLTYGQLTQWEAVWQMIDEDPNCDPIRPIVFGGAPAKEWIAQNLYGDTTSELDEAVATSTP